MKWPLALCLLWAPVVLQAQTFTTLSSFNATAASPSWLIQGADGNFYGIAFGGVFGNAAIFQLTPTGALTPLYTFVSGPAFYATSLIQTSSGNFYGTTYADGPGVGVMGTIFTMTPLGVLTTLHNFQGLDGFTATGIIQGADGNFYGATGMGGSDYSSSSDGFGTIFKMTPDGTLTTLYSFTGTDDGGYPQASPIQGTDGNFYGTTEEGGTGVCRCGTIFKITPQGVLTTLYSFLGTDGANPRTSLIEGTDGNFYGTTQVGGSGVCQYLSGGTSKDGCGTIFKTTPEGSFTSLYSFDVNPGANPQNGLLQGTDGNFYGTTEYGGIGHCPTGVYTGCGTIFKMTPQGSLTTLYSFAGGAAGNGPISLLEAADRNLYGTTLDGGTEGGAIGDGTFFEFALSLPILPAISASGGVLNGASFQPGISPGSWMTINGTNLSSKTDTWNNSIVNGALPITLDGVSVMVGGQPAYIEYVSPTQINAVAPNVPAGSVPVTVTTPNGTSQAVTAQLSAEQPAFFQWGTYVVATRQDFSLAVKNGTFPGTTTIPAKPGDVIILWGSGFGPTSPAAPAGVETPATTTYNTATAVSVSVGNQPATVYGAALAPGYAGLYQVAIQIPAGLANGDYPVVATIADAQSPSTTLITVQQ